MPSSQGAVSSSPFVITRRHSLRDFVSPFILETNEWPCQELHVYCLTPSSKFGSRDECPISNAETQGTNDIASHSPNIRALNPMHAFGRE